MYPASYVTEYNEEGYSTEVYNEISTTYSEPEEYYGEKDLPVYFDTDWIADDNHIPRQMALPLLFVTDKIAAAKLQKQEIYVSRTPATCTLSNLPFGFIRIDVGKLVTLANSNLNSTNDRVWIVKGRSQNARGDISLILREYAGASAFDFNESTEVPGIDAVSYTHLTLPTTPYV